MKRIITTVTADSIVNGTREEQAGRKKVMKVRNNAERGFTLIELLAAMGALAALIAGFHG